ncbi:MAG: hypothetical protein HC837_10170 [Chloroflexaceae bacterium]|nr:hypothetical protein [Chloroflexaceae bacterium]
MAIREGRWDCQYCGKTGILGREQGCPGCGRVRPEGTKFYLLEDAPEVTDEHLQERAQAGADWVCAFCGTTNEAQRDPCKQCGASKSSSESQQQVKTYELHEVPRTGDNAPDETIQPEPSQVVASRSSALPMLPVIGGVLAVLLVCGLGIWFFVLRTTEQQVTVDGFSWERTIEIEEMRTVTEEDWDVPSGGRVLDQRQEIHHYKQVLDHYETRTRQVNERVKVGSEDYVCGQRDLGNGFFEDKMCTRDVYETRSRTETYEEPIYRDEPVYRTRYTYEIDRWERDRTEKAQGNDQNPVWPDYMLASNQRAGERSALYRVHITDDQGKTYQVEAPEQRWAVLHIGDRVIVKFNAMGEPIELIFQRRS